MEEPGRLLPPWGRKESDTTEQLNFHFQVKQLVIGRGHLWVSDERILRYQVVLMENPGLTIFSCEVLNTATILPNPEGSLSLLPRNFAPLDKTPRRIVRRSCDQF